MDVSSAALRMPDPVPVRSLSPPPADRTQIPREQLLGDVFSVKNQKTQRTFWVDVIFNQRAYTLECKQTLNQASLVADRMRRFMMLDQSWVPCLLLLKENKDAPAQPTPVFLKRTPFFIPENQRLYHLPPPVFLEGSGNKVEPGIFFRKAYQFFESLEQPFHSRRIQAVLIDSHARPRVSYTFLSWSRESFVIDLEYELGRGTTKWASLALLVEVFTPYYFRVSKRALVRPLPGFEKIVDFYFPKLRGLFHANIGIPQEQEIRYQRINDDGRQWCRLTYCGEDLYKVMPRISSESTLYLIFSQMIAGLNYLFQNGLMHDDIKPSNWIVYVDNRGSGVVRLEDCESIREIKIGMTKRKPLQPTAYLPIHMRKLILGVISEQSLIQLTEKARHEIWKNYSLNYAEVAQASTNVLGYSLAEIYLVFRKNYPVKEKNRVILEGLIENLSGAPLRNSDGVRFNSISRYLFALDSHLRKIPLTTIEETIQALPSLDSVAETICRLYHASNSHTEND